MILLLLFATVFTLLTVHLWRGRQKNPKGPLPLPLIGNIHQLIYESWKAGGIIPGFNTFRKQYGNVFTLWLGPLPTVYISDYDVAFDSHVKRANVFSKRFTTGGSDYIREGRGIVGANGEFWQEHRRFALQTLRNFGLGRNIMEERIMEEFNYRIVDFRKTNWKNGAIEVHCGTFFDFLVGSIINQLLVSERFEQDNQEFQNLKKYLAETLEKLTLFDAFCPLWILKSRFMKWRTEKTFAPFDYVYELAQKTIQRRVDAIESGDHSLGEDGDDFVDAYLIKSIKDKKDGVQDSTFNTDNLAIDIYDLWLAGQETTATSLTWACACLLNHPEVVKKLREELMRVTGGNRPVSLTDRTETSYLNAVISEVQRVSSILNINVFRVVEEDTTIGGQPLAAGTVFTTQMGMIHTDEQLFKDHTEFRPDRFLEDQDHSLEKKLIPFGIGKRSCLGESLARAELYLILGNLVLNYNLEASGETPPIRSPTPFALLKRPPSFTIRFVPV